ncbi:MAG: transcription-repair coupling factor [Sedimentisphaerales bacterium]|nr:transcription-repair coupling factor [Sedimentisphaerales bacterium]
MPGLLDDLAHFILTPLDGQAPPINRALDAFAMAGQERTVEAYGSWGSLPRLLAALAAKRLHRPVVLITPHIPHADEAQDDLETFLAGPAELLVAAEATDEPPDPTSDVACQRLALCRKLGDAGILPALPQPVIVASIPALMQPLPAPEELTGQSLNLRAGMNLPNGPDGLAGWLTDHHFTRAEQVELAGDFAVRGGIVDIYPPGTDAPLRVEFFGDDIESLRYFDLDTRRSTDQIDTAVIAAPLAPAHITNNVTLLDYLPADTLLVVEEAVEADQLGRIYRERLSDTSMAFPIEDILEQFRRFDVLYVNRFEADLAQTAINLHAQSVQRFENRLVEGLEELAELARKQAVFLACENPAQQQRLGELTDTGKLHIPIGLIHQGFELPDSGLLFVNHHEVFGRRQQLRRIRRQRHIQAIESFTDLETGDLVVHVSHGIGRFKGMKTLTKNDRPQEFLALEYADRAILHVPAENIHLVHKYVGALGRRPKLSKLGGTGWAKAKQKVADAVEDVAARMIEIQAARATCPAICYPSDTTWQKEFEASFGFQDTEDQVTASRDIKTDLQAGQPMDRLLCGDVGYGKTELAIRAAFKVAEYGKQVAVLVPTTVLADQHYRTFCERLADFPFTVEVLSRFKTPAQARDIILRTAAGQVDILIGTHRLLSEDVKFKDLGLVIIDEEQRFGVEHKERLKHLRETVEVLTMTATPIPRTLHMALLGLRDISSLTTPPLDRRSIVTEVRPYDNRLIRQAILQELAREGQTFFLHNRVQNIQTVADNLRKLVPEARIIVGHGQMPKHELEARMLEFVHHQADVLVSTTIIESGLDIPNANTIIINDADRFGLAELHQLRGRVGRYKNRAHAYMLLPAKRSVNPTAAKRLKAIEEYSQLGSGFRIAMRDLEIRGAGNILGVEQSGHIDAVGYELYCRLLASAVEKRRGRPEPPPVLTHLELDIHSIIPRNYIASNRQRMEAYRRLTTCATPEELDQLEADLNDQFGKPPRSVLDLLQLAEIRTYAGRWGIKSIIQKTPDLIFTCEKMHKADNLFKDAPGRVSLPDPDTVYLRLPPNYFDNPQSLLAIMRKILRKTPVNADIKGS